jgi:hypothetical protein
VRTKLKELEHQRKSRESLGRECQDLSRAIDQFRTKRFLGSPQMRAFQGRRRGETGGFDAGREGLKQKLYNANTAREYEARFAKRVFDLTCALRDAGFVTAKEFDDLNSARTVNGMMRVAARLRKKSRQLGVGEP